MSINGKNSGITSDDLIASGKSMGLTAEFCRNAISQTESFVSDWLNYAEKCGITEETQRGIKLSNNRNGGSL